MPLSDKYNIARLVGKINKTINKRDEMPTILFGPGRWGTTTPAMGVPVTFSEIDNIAAIAEIAYKEGSLIPELSFGTHFFQDLVEMNIFYMAIYPENEKVIFNTKWMQEDAQFTGRSLCLKIENTPMLFVSMMSREKI